MRTFETGATRDNVEDKPHYAGYIGWEALARYGRYMLRHEIQADGAKRDPGNWKKGMPLEAWRDSLTRHVVDWNRAIEAGRMDEAEELACAIWFNVAGWLEGRMKGKDV